MIKFNQLAVSAFLFVTPFVAACSNGSGNNNTPAADLATVIKNNGDMALLSQCGHPGDVGNSLGVGKFCMTLADCGQNMICSDLGNGTTPSDNDTYFCTIYPCKADAGAAACGENATCVCGSGGGMSGCACTPNSCLGSTPDGG